jgi:hypothetical protein
MLPIGLMSLGQEGSGALSDKQPTDLSGPIHNQLLSTLAEEVTKSGAAFVYSTGLPSAEFQFPHSAHMTPRGIALLAELLATEIAKIPSGQKPIEFNPPGLLVNFERQP